MKELLGTLIFAAALGFLAFLAGIAVAIFQVYPFAQVRAAYQAIYDLSQGSTSELAVDDMHHLYPARYSESGVTVYKESQVQPGNTLITGYWYIDNRWQPAIRLIDLQGTVLQEWIVRPEQIWPTTPYTDHVAGQMNRPNNYVHGAWLLPDGDVVFNVEYAGMARINACSETVWSLPYRTHHSMFRDEAGNFWAAGLNWRYEKNPSYVHPKPDFVDETMLQVSPAGEILQEIFILESIYESGQGGLFADTQKKLDITHMNDVEVLGTEMAASFPLFNAGDILVSLRNISTILVVDGSSHQVKWLFRHPLVRQHDPDFEADGHIVVFDNRDDMTQTGARLGPTRLLRINPADNSWNTVYPLTDEQAFYTQTGGKHQRLENGNRLITEAHGGRVLEIDTDGNLVWNWIIETRGDGLVPEVLEGSRYPEDYANLDHSHCEAG